jgi:hypothetical protein
MTRARIDGFAAAQAAWDNAEEPCGPEPIEGSCHCCCVQIDGEPNRSAQYPEVVFEWMCPECEDAGLCRSCARKIEDEEITPPCVTRPSARGCVGETKESEI